MKKIVLTLALAACIHIAFCRYMGNVHNFIGRQALEYYYLVTNDDTFNNQSPAWQDFLQGVVDEDSQDRVYGYGQPGGEIFEIPELVNYVSYDVYSSVQDFVCSQQFCASISHFWNSDQSNLDLQEVGHADLLFAISWDHPFGEYISFSATPVHTAWAKAKKITFGDDGVPFHGEMDFMHPSNTLEFALVDGTGNITANPDSQDNGQYRYMYKIFSMDDFLLNHNIMIDTGSGNYEYVCLGDQFSTIMDPENNPEYLLLGSLCHLLMDMCVPAHAHNDAHVPTFKLTGSGLMPDDLDNYEGWGNIETITPGGYLRNNTDRLDGVWECSNVENVFGLGLISMPSIHSSDEYLFDLFFTLNQISQFFASEDVQGNMYVIGVPDLTQYEYLYTTLNNLLDLTQSDQDYYDLTQTTGVSGNCNDPSQLTRFNKMRDELISLAIRGTASLVDWWQRRYDQDWQPWGPNVIISGQVVNPNVDHLNTSVKIRKLPPDNQNDFITVTPDDSGYFEIPVFNPTQSNYELWIENGICHPIYTGINVPGHDDNMDLVFDVGSFPQDLLDETGLHVGSQNPYSSFPIIEMAVDYAVEHNITRITIEPGTYTESFSIHVPDDSDLTELEIYGTPLQTIVKPINSLFRHISITNTSSLDRFEIKDIIFDGESKPACLGAIQLNGNINNAIIQNCTIKNYCGTGMDFPDDEHGRAIRTASPTLISSCRIFNNSGLFLDEYGVQGIVSIRDSSLIENCQIWDNSAADAGAIYVRGNGSVINNCKIYDNKSIFPEPAIPFPDAEYGPYSQTLGIKCSNAADVTIMNNTFYDNGCDPDHLTSGSVIGIFNESVPGLGIKILNNTFSNNVSTYPTELRAIRIGGHSVVEVTNNIIEKHPTALLEDADSNSSLAIANNLFFNNTNNFAGVDYDQQDNPGNCLFEDPVLGYDFVPIWNADVISPCIDAGIGEKDPDGTPPDIGAKRAVAHEYWEYEFTTQADQEKWYWVSYPVLNSVTDGMLQASEFFEELLPVHLDMYEQPTPTFLDEIDWMVQGNSQNIYWDENEWSIFQNTFVTSPQGYKVKLLERAPATVTLKETGLRTPSDTPFPIHGGEVDNWLGYFRADSAWPHEVFASIWDDITMIRTKSWCLVRSDQDGDYWGLHGKVTTLNDGDMVIVTTLNDHNTFQWNNADATPPEDKALPEYFVFDEKQDYVPVYLSIPDSLMTDLKEIGLYLDGVCKGAVVIEDNLEQICAYLDIGEQLTDGVVEFIFYYNDGKSQEKKTVRMDPGLLSARYVNGNLKYPYFDIEITSRDLDNMIPPELTLGQNCPNPFNPRTLISYQLPAACPARLGIYNARGQLVRTLVNAEQEAGYHSVVWNGTDDAGRNVASGIYFYRLSSPGKTLTRKMLLMK
ncbi:MAG: FlgD immunoglobulin-like domain containing protein [Candidatus Syntrophosphaera sp.]